MFVAAGLHRRMQIARSQSFSLVNSLVSRKGRAHALCKSRIFKWDPNAEGKCNHWHKQDEKVQVPNCWDYAKQNSGMSLLLFSEIIVHHRIRATFLFVFDNSSRTLQESGSEESGVKLQN